MKIYRYAPTNPNVGTTTDDISAEKLKEKLASESTPKIDVDLTVDKLGSRNSRAVINFSMDDLEVLHQDYTQRLKARVINLEKQLNNAQWMIGKLNANLNFIGEICSEATFGKQYDEQELLSYITASADAGCPEKIDDYFETYDYEQEKDIDLEWIEKLKEKFDKTVQKPKAGYIDFNDILDR